MPVLSQSQAPDQAIALPTDRTLSSIPRADQAAAKWEYPSPQQFYNALVRKGWETPEEHVQTMVHIHNFLNERAWDEVLRWEREHNGDDNVQLERFMGKPGTLSPKARLLQFAGWLLPERFSSEPPFDRHDWLVRRPRTNESVRYVIDYYSAPPEPDGSPVFSLDVRPAIDGWEGMRMRIGDMTEGVWKRERERERRV
ncbi:cytochrome c and c1 heme-lyase [Heliocybe sulcata]|uniref:Holocytochrome c-type synthase n=1 Tax=Heliocybe sulcata TaxID=5364 RepID=A0A5C3N3J5_9AGAM|nr:cytochrome c and c1 heme-lyase [Heliocybe sulcata]